MIILIVMITIILYIILVSFTLQKLKSITEPKVKILYLLIGMIIMLISTLIVFNISASGVEYENTKMVGNVRNMILAVFVPVNGLIVMPYLANLVSKIKLEEITQEQFKRKAIILAIIFIVILIFECSYFKNIQLGIVDIINKK